MKRRSTSTAGCRSLIAAALFLAAALGCSNPFGRFTKQYKCQVPGKSDPQTAYQYVERGMEHVRAEQFDCALGACSEAIRLDSRLATAYACRGGVLSNTGEYLKAIKDYDQALSLQPDNGDFYYGRAQVHDHIGNTELALNDSTKAVELIKSEFGRSVAFALRARIYERQRKLDEAISDYSEAIRLAPDFAYHHSNRAEVYSEKKEYQKAIADYSEAIKLDPKNPYFRRDRAKVYRALRQDDFASQDEEASEMLSSKTVTKSEENTTTSQAPVISAGDLTSEAIALPKPAYPPIAKVAHASGTVVVQVTIDENGRVVSSNAVSGHPLLQAAALAAARQARFNPRKLSGKPVRVTGTIRYVFEGRT
jgi:TonB family protein